MRKLFAILGALVLAATLVAGEAEKLYKRGRKAEKRGDAVQALLYYAQARALEPSNPRWVRASQGARGIAAMALAAAGADSAVDADGAPPEAGSSVAARPPQPLRVRMTEPVRLDYASGRRDFRLKGSVSEVYEAVAEAFGLRLLFDDELVVDREVRLDLDFADFPEAVAALNDVTKSFVVPLSRRLFLVAEDNPNKRGQLEPVAAATIELPEAATPEAAQELLQAVQQTLDIRRLQRTGDSIVVRDTVRKVRLATAIYRALSLPPGEAVIEVEVHSVTRDRAVDLGVSLPSDYPITNFSTVFNAAPAPPTPEEAARMIGVGGGETIFGVTIGTTNLVAELDRGDSTQLDAMRLRALHGAEAVFKVGEQFPIVTGRFDSILDDVNQGGQVRPAVPSIIWEDLGLVLTVTPSIHDAREMTLQVEAEFRQLSGRVLNDIPVLANRRFQSRLRLAEGEVAVLSGIGVAERRVTVDGVRGLSEIPLLGRLFRVERPRVSRAELLVTIRPRLIRLPPSEIQPSLTIRYGPEERPLPAL